jgi:hypothetical protein
VIVLDEIGWQPVVAKAIYLEALCKKTAAISMDDKIDQDQAFKIKSRYFHLKISMSVRH